MVRIATLAVLALVVAGSAVAITSAPRLTIMDRQPLVVRGTHFAPRELVRITASAGEAQTQRVRATRLGSFVATFDEVVVDRCSGLWIRAVGARGSVAVLRLPQPACPPA